MLPDFPEIKGECNRLLVKRAKARKAAEMGAFSGISEVALFEGDNLLTIHEDGSRSESKFIRSEASHEMKYEELEKLTVEELVARFDKFGEDFARQQVKQLFKVVDEAVESVGNVVRRAPDESLTEVFFRMIEQADMDFDDQGNPQMRIVCGPDLAPKLAAAQAEFDANPELKRRHEQILRRKHEEWRDRESNRQLVD